jgi:hypothetical protein
MEHRISVTISPSLHRRLQRSLPWGTQAAVIRRVVELLIDKIEKDGYNTIQLLIAAKYDPLEEFEKSEQRKEDV